MNQFSKSKARMFLVLVALIFFGTRHISAAQIEKSSEAYSHYLKAMIEEGHGNLAVAQEELKKALELAPNNVKLEQEAAEMAFRQNQFQEASLHVEKAISLDPKNVKLHILAGQIYWALGQQDKAEAKLKRAVELGPDEAEALVNLALAVTPKDPKRAIKLYNDYLARHPSQQEIYERVAQLYQTTGDLKKAEASWDKVLELEPDSIRAHLASAQLAEVQHDTSTAISHYESVLEQDPSNLPLLLRIGELRYRADEMAKAYDAFTKAQSIAPDSASANFWLALIAENRSDWNEAIRLLKSVAQKAPEPGVLLRLSYYYSQIGQQKEAIRLLKKLSDDEPENTDFIRYLAVAYESDKQFDNALKAVSRLIAIDPENAEHYFHQATLYDRLNQFPASEAALKKAIQLDPQFHMAMNYLGFSYADKNINLVEAEKLVNDAIALDPDNGAYLDSMGWVAYRQGKFKKAEDFLKQAAEEAKDPLIRDHLGDVQAAQAHFLDALSSWQTSLLLDGTQTNVVKKIEKALTRLTTPEKLAFFLEKNRQNFSTLSLLKGLARISVCDKKPCWEVKAQFDYSKGGVLKAEVPGPMGVPLFIVSKSTSAETQYGSLSPQFLSIESYVRKAFNRIDRLMRASLFESLNPKLLSETAIVSKGEIRAQNKDLLLLFNEKSGTLTQIVWGAPGGSDSLTLRELLTNSSPSVPAVWEWKDDPTGFSLKLTFVKPIVRSSLITLEKE